MIKIVDKKDDRMRIIEKDKLFSVDAKKVDGVYSIVLILVNNAVIEIGKERDWGFVHTILDGFISALRDDKLIVVYVNDCVYFGTSGMCQFS